MGHSMKKGSILLALCLVLLSFTGCQSTAYRQAQQLYEDGEYEEAVAAFSELAEYQDSAEMMEKSLVGQGNACIEQGDYAQAVRCFAQIPENEEAVTMLHTAVRTWVNKDFMNLFVSATTSFSSLVQDMLDSLSAAFSGSDSTFDWTTNEHFATMNATMEQVQTLYDAFLGVFTEDVLALCDAQVQAVYDKLVETVDYAQEILSEEYARNYTTNKLVPDFFQSERTLDGFAQMTVELEDTAELL